MNSTIRTSELSRRQVMIGAAGLSVAFAIRPADAAVLATERAGQAMSPWISIGTDGTITIMSAATEMGQGSMTALPLIIAEELDADWAKVRIVPAPPLDHIYGNPGFAGMMYTAGSNAVTSYYVPLRIVGAQARRVLLDNAAHKWGVPVEELTTEPSVVVHVKSGRRLTYGDIAAFAEVPAKAPDIKPEQLKKAADFRSSARTCCVSSCPARSTAVLHTASTCRCRVCCTARCCGRRLKDRSRTRSQTQRPRRCPASQQLSDCRTVLA